MSYETCFQVIVMTVKKGRWQKGLSGTIVTRSTMYEELMKHQCLERWLSSQDLLLLSHKNPGTTNWILGPTWSSSQIPITAAPKFQTSPSGLCGYLSTRVHVYSHNHIQTSTHHIDK